jgi:hypothetical protein
MLRTLLLLLLILPCIALAQPKEKTKRAKRANALLIASVSGKLTGLTFGALATRAALLSFNNEDTPQKKAFQLGMAGGWGFAAIAGGAAYVVDDTQVRPWMFYAEVASYGIIGAALGGLAIHSSLQDEASSSEEARLLGIRAAIFLSASASAGGAAYLLKRQQEPPIQVSLSPTGVVATLHF